MKLIGGKMITHDEARALAMAKVRSMQSRPDNEFVIVDAATREEDFGWVFFYNSKRYLETRDILFRIAGNGPIVVDGVTGAITLLGTAGGVAHQLSEYRQLKVNGTA